MKILHLDFTSIVTCKPATGHHSRGRSLGLALLGVTIAACTPQSSDPGESGATDTGVGTEDAGGQSSTADPDGADTASGTTPDDTSGTSSETETDGDGGLPDDGAFACELEEPCTVGYFGCTAHSGCEERPYGRWTEGQVCLLELMRDIGSQPPDTYFEYSYDRGGSPEYSSTAQTLLLSSDGTVDRQRLLIDHKFDSETLFPVEGCTLREPAFFQDCLDNPSWSCAEPNSWYTDCAEVEGFECPGA